MGIVRERLRGLYLGQRRDSTYSLLCIVGEKIGCLLTSIGIITVFLPSIKRGQLLRSVKDDLSLRDPGVYRILCSCGDCHVGQTGCIILVYIYYLKEDPLTFYGF